MFIGVHIMKPARVLKKNTKNRNVKVRNKGSPQLKG